MSEHVPDPLHLLEAFEPQLHQWCTEYAPQLLENPGKERSSGGAAEGAAAARPASAAAAGPQVAHQQQQQQDALLQHLAPPPQQQRRRAPLKDVGGVPGSGAAAAANARGSAANDDQPSTELLPADFDIDVLQPPPPSKTTMEQSERSYYAHVPKYKSYISATEYQLNLRQRFPQATGQNTADHGGDPKRLQEAFVMVDEWPAGTDSQVLLRTEFRGKVQQIESRPSAYKTIAPWGSPAARAAQAEGLARAILIFDYEARRAAEIRRSEPHRPGRREPWRTCPTHWWRRCRGVIMAQGLARFWPDAADRQLEGAQRPQRIQDPP
ncbi:hypothetical protein JKP88DRAFT_351610 [Tribonema minus]|uniref:Uncharacterized protein n=1 Tax=Tribonema minus TaxID=303371 RepID=A0A836C828_9STRA|nr:hypothetical protein JKP88DRAFT_351610 [Tribonema minus]